jgi:translocation and assembly module TamB
VAAALRLIGLVALGLVALIAFGLLVLDSPLGHRLVTDRIAALRVQSGLAIAIGRIDGSLFGAAQLHDVVLADPAGRFMTVPEVDLDWRPLPVLRLVAGLGGGLDIRDLTLHRGLLLRAPRLNPADPNAPILPDFDIRIDRLAVDGMTVAPGLAGARRRIDLVARAQVHDGRVVLACDGRLGGRDKLSLHLDSVVRSGSIIARRATACSPRFPGSIARYWRGSAARGALRSGTAGFWPRPTGTGWRAD